MTSPDMDDEAMKAMAERIGNEFAPYDDTATGCAIATVVRKAALAAIIETQERCAALMQEIAGPLPKGVLNGEVWILHRIAAAIRSGQQFRKDV